MSDEDLIRRGDAIELARKQCLLSVDDLRALPAVQVAVKPECGHPWCGDKCGTDVSTAQPSPDVAALVEAADKLLDAYSAIVGAGNPWGDELRAALARVKGGAA